MEPATWTIVKEGVGAFGFPIFVAVWLLVRSDRHTKDLTKAIRELTNLVRECPKRR